MENKENTNEDNKIVWIACRAEGCNCEGKQAKLLMSKSLAAVGSLAIGSFEAQQGGRYNKYRCLTCGGIFVICS